MANSAGRKRCSTCLWCWPDIHETKSGKHYCHCMNSSFYHRERVPTEAACGAHEKRVVITERSWSQWVQANKE